MDITKDNELLYFFGNGENLTFICNQIVPELDKLVEHKIIFSNANKNEEVRKQNYTNVFNVLKKFFSENTMYNPFLKRLDKEPIKRVLEAYVYYKLKADSRTKHISVFEDKRSILYLGFDLTDILG